MPSRSPDQYELELIRRVDPNAKEGECTVMSGVWVLAVAALAANGDKKYFLFPWDEDKGKVASRIEADPQGDHSYPGFLPLYSGMACTVSGGIGRDESPFQVALREIEEELELKLDARELRKLNLSVPTYTVQMCFDPSKPGRKKTLIIGRDAYEFSFAGQLLEEWERKLRHEGFARSWLTPYTAAEIVAGLPASTTGDWRIIDKWWQNLRGHKSNNFDNLSSSTDFRPSTQSLFRILTGLNTSQKSETI